MPVAAGAGEGDPCRWSPAVAILTSDLREAHDAAGGRVATDADRILGGELAFEDGLGQRVLNLLLNGALERPRAEHRSKPAWASSASALSSTTSPISSWPSRFLR